MALSTKLSRTSPLSLHGRPVYCLLKGFELFSLPSKGPEGPADFCRAKWTVGGDITLFILSGQARWPLRNYGSPVPQQVPWACSLSTHPTPPSPPPVAQHGHSVKTDLCWVLGPSSKSQALVPKEEKKAAGVVIPSTKLGGAERAFAGRDLSEQHWNTGARRI